MPTRRAPPRRPCAQAASRWRVLGALLGALALLAACGSPGAEPPTTSSAFEVNTSPEQQRIRAEQVADIARRVPFDFRADGVLVVGTTGDSPPLSFRADDAMTLIGVEPDLAQLVADVLGLELELRTIPWELLFDAVESGAVDIGLGNITLTPERQRRFDMVTYQKEEQAWAVLPKSPLRRVDGPQDIAGLTVGVGAGTVSEAILRDWNDRNTQAGREPARLVNYSDGTAYYDGLLAGEVDAIFGPMSILNFHAVTTRKIAIVGTVLGAGDRSAEIAAIIQPGSGLAWPVSQAVDAVIVTGKYQAALDRWALGHSAVGHSRVAEAR